MMTKRFTVALTVVSLMATMAAQAEIGIAVSWQSGALGSPGNFHPGESYHQLLWSASNPFGANGVWDNGTGDDFVASYTTANLTDANGLEVVLWEGTSTAGSVGTLPASYATARNFVNSDVGGLDILNGYLYSRIFDDDSDQLGAGSMYYQTTSFTADEMAPLLAYDNAVSPPPPTQVISHQSISGFAPVNAEMVPEPGALSLLALGLVTLAIRHRRKK
jgi:hypothetical protein